MINMDLKKLIFKAIGLAMGIATLVLNIMNKLENKSAITLLSIGLICLAISALENKKAN